MGCAVTQTQATTSTAAAATTTTRTHTHTHTYLHFHHRYRRHARTIEACTSTSPLTWSSPPLLAPPPCHTHARARRLSPPPPHPSHLDCSHMSRSVALTVKQTDQGKRGGGGGLRQYSYRYRAGALHEDGHRGHRGEEASRRRPPPAPCLVAGFGGHPAPGVGASLHGRC